MSQMFRIALLGLFCAVTSVSLAQIVGKVTDASTGGALPGATVMVEGATTGVASATDGTFSLNAQPTGNITVSFIGYETALLAAKANRSIGEARDPSHG